MEPKELKIGNVRLENPYILAPMAGVTDLPFRLLCKEMGAGLIEVFNNAEAPLPQGTIRHFALATDDVGACVKAVRDAGYEVFIEPKDIEIQSSPVFPARIAFCKGPLGEEIEFFQEK